MDTTAQSSGAGKVALHFENAPWETVLGRLSANSDLIINLNATLRGRVTLSSPSPVSRDEAVRLLTTELDKQGYTAVQVGRNLTISNKRGAAQREVPVRVGNRPETVDKTEETVTQVIPVHYVSVAELARTLSNLLPETASLIPNQSGNALILTDTQTSIRRMLEIVRAIDTAVPSQVSFEVFRLQFADAKSLAGLLKDLFSPQDTTRGGGTQQTATQNNFAVQAAPGSTPAPATEGSQTADPGHRSETTLAVAEERSNSVLVRTSPALLPSIRRLVAQLDITIQDLTQARVFHLRNADAQDTADLLTSLFGSSGTKSDQDDRGPVQQYAGDGTGSAASNSETAAASQGSRLLKKSTVVAVPDARTSSVIVSAGRELMPQIEQMVVDLDSSPKNKQEVFVFNVQNSSASAVEQLLAGLFPSTTANGTARTGSSSQQSTPGNQLDNRATQQQNRSSPGMGSGNGLGGGLGSGGGGLGGTGR
jgi:general secretion pathway protein D